MRSALLEALPAAVLVASEGFAVAFTVSWLVLAPLFSAPFAWTGAPVVGAACAVLTLVAFLRASIRARQNDEARL